MTDELGAGSAKKKRGCGFWILVAVGIVLLLGVIGAIFGPSDEEMAQITAEREAEEQAEAIAETENRANAAQERRDQATKLTARELRNAYRNNEVSAQRALEGRDLLVTGTIESIELDFMDEPVISLATGEMFESVQVDFDEGDADAVSQLSNGMRITVLCETVSEVIGTPMLDDCSLLPNE